MFYLRKIPRVLFGLILGIMVVLLLILLLKTRYLILLLEI